MRMKPLPHQKLQRLPRNLQVNADGLQPGDLSRQMEFGDFALHAWSRAAEHLFLRNSRQQLRSQ